LLGDGYSALVASNAARLREIGSLVAASAATQRDDDRRAAVQTAAADLIWAAFLIDAGPFHLRPNWSNP
jgi:hypothetical protein